MKTKTFLFTVIAFLFTSLQTMAQNNDKHILVAYFSATGTTARAAEKLANVTGGELYAITPAESYTSADLDWHDRQSRSSVEMNDKNSRPALADRDAPVAGHDVILLGFPVWWYTAPTIINTFLEAYDFTGKDIVLFATSGGSGLGQTAADLSHICPGAHIRNGKLLNGNPSEASLRQWVASL